MSRSPLVLLPLVLACTDSTGPARFGPRIVEVPAIACPSSSATMAQCLRNGFPIDPALGDSAFHFTVLVPLFQNPPDHAWRMLTFWINGEMTQTRPVRLGDIDPPSRTVSDTIVFAWLRPDHPEIRIEIAMVEGEDSRFVRPVTDTLFIWSGRGS